MPNSKYFFEYFKYVVKASPAIVKHVMKLAKYFPEPEYVKYSPNTP